MHIRVDFDTHVFFLSTILYAFLLRYCCWFARTWLRGCAAQYDRMNKNSGAIDRDEVTALIEMLNEQDSKFVDNIRGAQEQILGDGMHMT